MSKPRLVVNMAKCLTCGDIIQSKSRHDFVTCKCGLLSVDGGSDYTRRVGDGIRNKQELSLYEDDDFMEIRKQLKRGSRDPKGGQPLKWVSLCDIDDSYLDSLIEYKEVLDQVTDVHYKMYCKERELREYLKCKDM